MRVREIQVPAGTIRYREAGRGRRSSSSTATWSTAGSGTGWSTALADRFRCIVPDLAVRRPPDRDGPRRDLDPPGLAKIVDDLLAALGLEDVTLVGNDSGGAVSPGPRLPPPRPASPASSSPTATPTRTSRRGSSRRCRRSPSCPAACGRWRAPFRIPAVARLAFSPFAKTRTAGRAGRRLDRRRPSPTRRSCATSPRSPPG